MQGERLTPPPTLVGSAVPPTAGPFFLAEARGTAPSLETAALEWLTTEPTSLPQRWRPMAKLLQHQIIERALEIISDEARWTRGAMARNKFGHSCSAWDHEAIRFCAVGAIYRAAFDLLGESLDGTIIEIAETCVLAANGLEHSSLPSVNDHDGRDEVVAMFQRALA
jgi:hypothetical protein